MLPPENLSDDKLLAHLPRERDGRPTIGGYPLLRKLGAGAMGSVYYAVHPGLRKEVAIKILPFHLVDQDPALVNRFLGEARMAASLESDHVVKILDVGEQKGTYYLVMQYVAGDSAGALLRKVKRLPEKLVLTVARAAAKGLADAHAKGIIHRDIKPDNILIPADAPERAKLADLGLAKPEKADHTYGTASHVAMGTPGFMAPEQAEDARSAGPPADVFAFGATLYAMLAGGAPFRGTSLMAVMRAAAEEDHVPLPDNVSPALRAFVDRCLEKDPEDRFANGADLVAAIEEVVAHPESVDARAARRREKPKGRPKRRIPVVEEPPAPPRARHAWGWALLPVGLAVLVIAVIVLRRTPEEPEAPPAPSPVDLAKERAAKGDLEAALAALAGVDGAEAAMLRDEWKKRLADKREKAELEEKRKKIEQVLAQVEALEKDKRYDDALAVLSQAVALDPDDKRVRDAKARLEGAIRTAKSAEERSAAYRTYLQAADAARATAEAKDTSAAWHAVYEALTKARGNAQTPEEFRTVDGEIRRAAMRVGWAAAREMESKGNLPKALQQANEAIKRGDPPEALVQFRDRLAARVRAGESAAARKKEFDALSAKARSAVAAEALELWRQAIEVADDPKDAAEARARIAELEAKAASPDAARLYDAAVKEAQSLLAAGKLDEAVAQFREALKHRPGDAAAQEGIARVDVIRHQKAYDAAMAEGKAFEKNREWWNAKAAYEKALVAKPGDRQAKKEIDDIEREIKRNTMELALVDGGKVKLTFILVKAGTFTMGDKDGEKDEKVHEVVLTRDFFLTQTEITQLQWEAVMGSNASAVKGPDLPVTNVSWDDAQAFVKKLNQRLRADRVSLPTEAQWEYAYRAGTKTRLPWGDALDGFDTYGWHEGNSKREPHPVAQKKANPWGFHDMGGGVWEWCQDMHGEYPSGRVADPQGAAAGERVIRGGCFGAHPHEMRSGNRAWHNPGERHPHIGLRVVFR